MKMSLYTSVFCGTIFYSFSLQAACVTPPDCADLGYTIDASKCVGAALKCPWDLTKAACKEKEEIKIGSYIYSDMSISNKVIANKTIIAIIADTSSRLAISLNIETSKKGTETDTFCKNYTTQGTSAGSWSCPTMNDLQLIYNNKSILNDSLHNAGRPRLNGEDNIDPVYGNNWRYWSSEMDNSDYRRGMLLGKGNITRFENTWPGYTIPVRKY